jgi:3-oxoacyl-[acyl-carrier-protein] synthase II
MMRARRVVVTGVGVVSPLGVGARLFWERMCANASGIEVRSPRNSRLKTLLSVLPLPPLHPSPPTHRGRQVLQSADGSVGGMLAARVPRGSGEGAFDASRVVPKAHVRAMSPEYIAMGLCAAEEALRESGLEEARGERRERGERDRWGVSFGSGIGGLEETEEAAGLVASGQGRKVSPYYVPRMLVNMAAGSIATVHGLRGPLGAPATACATGASAVGEGLRAIQSDSADVMVVGGAESCVTPLALVGFSRLRALAGVADAEDLAGDATNASRPFDRRRSGFVLGEGAAALVLEEREHARSRGARILAEVVGFGASADAHHPTQPPHDGDGAARAMRAALRDAHAAPNDVDWVSAHATSTPLGDAAELRALHAVFGHSHAPRPRPLPVSSLKGHVGHLLGAAGALEAVLAVQSILNATIPHTRGLLLPDDDVPPSVDLVHTAPRPHPVRTVLSNSFGFGGVNVALLFRKDED